MSHLESKVSGSKMKTIIIFMETLLLDCYLLNKLNVFTAGFLKKLFFSEGRFEKKISD